MKKVAVALSGGVDSSVTAYLLKKEGYEVFGITGKMVNTDAAETVIKNAKAVADFLEIEHYVADVSKEFQTKIIDYFDETYKQGKTPNPCIMCNKFIKWGALFEKAINELGADYIATGHYANIKQDGGYYKLYPAADTKKDQLYFLFQLNQQQLSKTMFPLWKYTKPEIRQIAEQNNLPTKSSKESQDICFITKPLTAKKYLLDRIPSKTGDFVDITTGKKIGEHDGYFQYTTGQRKGIGIAAAQPLYVISTDSEKNIVYVGTKEHLEYSEIVLDNFIFSYPYSKTEFYANVKIRYNMQPVKAQVKVDGLKAAINFTEPVNAISKGQACVLYDIDDNHLIGGGFI